MRPNQKRSRGLSPLVIRSLGVLAITLMAMTTATTSSASVPDCTDCPPWSHSHCLPDCQFYEGHECQPRNVLPRCTGCYEWKCTSGQDNRCQTQDPDEGPVDGQRVLCVLEPDAPSW